MKTKVRILCVLFAVLILAPALAGCGRQLVFRNLHITDKKTGIEYSYVNSVYEPKSVGTEVYATWKQNGIKINFYEVEGLAPEQWLVSEFGDLIYSGDEELPDLAGFGASSAMLCDSGGKLSVALANIHEQEKVDAIIDAFMNGKNDEYKSITASAYSVKFESETYSELYYNLLLVVYDDGTYLYDRYSGRCVNVGTMFDEYLYS